MLKKYGFNTRALHAGAVIDETNARGVPLHRTSSYVFNSGKRLRASLVERTSQYSIWHPSETGAG